MMRLIRWTYVAPRAVLLITAVVGLMFALPWLLKWSLTTSGESAVGAKVDISRVDVSLLNTNVTVRGVTVADPDKPMRNLLQAERIELEIEPGSLARKRLVVRTAAIHGLEFGTSRTASGLLDQSTHEAESTAVGKLTDALAERGGDWLNGYWNNLTTKLEEDLRKEYQSIALAEQLAAKWPGTFADYERRAKSLYDRASAIERVIRSARQNPLRHLAELQQAGQNLQQVNVDLARILNDLNTMPKRMAHDRQQVVRALQHDQQKLQHQIAQQPIDAQGVADYLLQDEVAGRVGTVVRWAQRIRELMPSKKVAKQERFRGAEVLFAGMTRHPDVLVRSLQLSGKGRLQGEEFDLSGNVIGLTSQPKLYGQPVLVTLAGRGSVTLDIEAQLDRTGDVPLDVIHVSCPTLPRSETVLGDADALALSLGSGHDALTADIKLEQDTLTGTIVIQTRTSHVHASARGSAANAHLAGLVNDSLTNLRSIETALHLSGTLRKPNVKLESSLGGQLKVAFQQAATRELQNRRDQVQLAMQREVDEQLGAIDQQVTDFRDRMQQQLTKQQQALVQMAAQSAGLAQGSPGTAAASNPLGTAVERFGRAVRSRSNFRR